MSTHTIIRFNNTNRQFYTEVKKRVDGYFKETNTIYKFHGCYFQGCKDCYNNLTVNKILKLYMYQLYTNTMLINEAISEV